MPSRADFAMAHAEEITCEICFAMLKEHCRRSGLPEPNDVEFKVPRRWLLYVCPHVEGGILLKELLSQCEPSSVGAPRGTEETSVRWKAQDEELEVPGWRNNLDATKGIGYPCREEGRYGSHPSHDGFDDESAS